MRIHRLIPAALAAAALLAPTGTALAAEATPGQQKCLDAYTAATHTAQERADTAIERAETARRTAITKARRAWEATGRDPMASDTYQDAIDLAWARYDDATSTIDYALWETTRKPARTLEVCLANAPKGKPDRLSPKTLASPQATVAALASFVATHLATGAITPNNATLVGDGTTAIWGSPFDGLILPTGYTVTWDYDMGSYCVSGNGYRYLDYQGAVSPGTCPTDVQ